MKLNKMRYTYDNVIQYVSANSFKTAKDCKSVIEELVNFINEAASEGDEVNIPKLGIFKIKTIKARNSWVGYDFRNNCTREYGAIPAHRKLYFQPTKQLKEAVREIK